MTDISEQTFTPTRDWKPVPRISRTIPFGYKVDPENDKVLLPVVLELEALEKARTYVKRFSYRAVADWLFAVTGRKLSHLGLKKRFEVERARQRRASASQHWARRYEKAEATARKLEEERIGASAPLSD